MFVIISGYFSIQLNTRKFLTIVIELLIYTFFFKTLPYFFVDGNLKQAVFSIINNNYWFVVEYLILMMFAPMINSFLDRVSRKEFQWFISGLLFVSCYLGFIWKGPDNMSGYELFQFIMLYTVGRYVSIYKVHLKTSKALAIYIVLSLLTGILYGTLYMKGFPNYAYRMTNYNSPFLIAASLSFFLIFLNFNFRSQIVNNLSKSTLSIYLISGSFLGPYYYRFVESQFCMYGNFGAVYSLILGLFFFLIIAFMIDPVQRKVNRVIVDKILIFKTK